MDRDEVVVSCLDDGRNILECKVSRLEVESINESEIRTFGFAR